MDAAVAVSNNRNTSNNGRDEISRRVASEITSLYEYSAATENWQALLSKISANQFRVETYVLDDFAFFSALRAPQVAADLLENHERHVIAKFLDQTLSFESKEKILFRHIKIARHASALAFLRARVNVESIFAEFGRPMPKEFEELIALCDQRFDYTAADLVGAGFKRSLAKEGLYKDPITGAEIDVSPRKGNSDRGGRRSFGSREERGRNDMIATFEPGNRPPKKYKEIPVISKEEMEANRLAKVEGRLARRDAARKAAANRKQQQKTAKKADSKKQARGK